MGSLGWGHLDNAESVRLLRIKVRQQHAFCRVKWLLDLGSFLPVTCWLRQKIWLNALVFGYGHKLFRTRDNSDILAVHPYISIASAFTDGEAMFTYTTWLTKQCARFCCKLPFPNCGFKSLILIILFLFAVIFHTTFRSFPSRNNPARTRWSHFYSQWMVALHSVSDGAEHGASKAHGL